MSNNQNGSDFSGSPEIKSVPNPNSFGDALGETQTQKASQVDPEQHKELESLVGRQGEELGEFRKFFSDIEPLLKDLEKNPDIVQAIMDGKITNDLAKAAMEGKVSVSDAAIVKEAHEEVKKDLGKKDYQGTSAEDINKLVENKARELKDEFNKQLKERDELNNFEATVNEFITNTPDFKEYAKEIDKWLDDHDVTDISVAYYAVKGKISEREALKKAEIERAELEKTGALNMGGGHGNATRIRGNSNIVDSLISSKSNPNIF